jgi:hypothetical protein
MLYNSGGGSRKLYRHVSFQDEYLALLSRHGVNFDERGVFG